MPRLARLVVPGVPHHVVQRGNRRQRTFFEPEDYRAYLNLLGAWTTHHSVRVLSYCLMPNHVHLVLVPDTEPSLAKAVGACHERYTRLVNKKKGWTGCLWQGRFFSCPMDTEYLLATVRYIQRNPVRARLVERCTDWRYSSARVHIYGEEDGLTDKSLLKGLIEDWQDFLREPLIDQEVSVLLKHVRTGRPLGSQSFVRRLESVTGRSLFPKKPGRKPHQ